MRRRKKAASQLDQAVKKTEGWVIPNDCLFLPAPEHFEHDKQVVTVGISYYTSSAFLNSATDTTTLDIVEAILGPNIETFGYGQSLVKEAVGRHPKHRLFN